MGRSGARTGPDGRPSRPSSAFAVTEPGRPEDIISSVSGTVRRWSRAASPVSPLSNASMIDRKWRGATFATVPTYPDPPIAYSARTYSSQPV